VELGITQTPALRRYFDLVGNATYLINTAIVGLEQIARGHMEKPTELTISWTPPKNGRQAADQSRTFILSSTLILTITACDSYLSDIAKVPWLVLSSKDRSILTKAETNPGKQAYSIRERIEILLVATAPGQLSNEQRKIGTAALELATLWRNAIVHAASSTRELSPESEATLITFAETLHETNGGIDVPLMLHNFKTSSSRPVLKEATTLVALVSRLLRSIDTALITNAIQDHDAMLRVALHELHHVFAEMPHSQTGSFFVTDVEARRRRFHQALARRGITAAASPITPTITSSDIDTMMQLSRHSFMELLEENLISAANTSASD
jgi:hypothetical protein